MAGKALGIIPKALVRAAPDDALLAFLPEALQRLLSALQPELLQGSQLRDLVAELWTPADLVADDATRAGLIRLLPADMAADLAKRLKLENPEELSRLIDAGSISPQDRRVLEKYFNPTVAPSSGGVGLSPYTVVAPRYGLFDYQRTAVKEVLESLESAPRRVVLHLPTGAGKTRVAMHVVCEHQRRRGPTVVLWLAYSSELLEQAADAFETAWGHVGDRDLQIMRLWGSTDCDFSSLADGIVVAGLGKLNGLADREYQEVLRLADRTTLTVMDEAHRSIATTYRQLLDLFATKRIDAALLGLTATPGRTWADIDADRELSAFFDRRKVTLQAPGYTNPVEFLIAQGYLARPTFVSLNIEAGLRLSAEDLRLLGASLEVPDGVLRQLAEDEQWNLRIVDTLEDLLARHRRIIFFATTVAHARLVALVLRTRRHAAEAITGETPWAARQSIIQRYRANTSKPMVICNYGVLTTGFDAPATSATLIARPTRSLVLYSQMVGRAIRGPRSGGNASAEIVTVIDPRLPGFGEIAEAFANWEDIWNQ
jgi:DNA repair protein RadD